MLPEACARNVLLMDSTLRVRTVGIGSGAFLVVALAVFLTACTYSATAGAHSGPATIGIPEKVDLWDCEDARDGPTLADFDKSLWLPVGADPAELVSLTDVADGPGDTATMTLVSSDRAEYRSDIGPVFTFERHEETFEFEGCVPQVWPANE